MQKLSALDYLAGVESTEKTQASAPTNLHVISGEVSSKSEDGIAKVSFDGLVYSEDETQEIEIEALGGLEEGDTVTILLSGEQGHGMTPLALGSVGSIDRIVTNVSEIQADYVKATELEADVAEFGYAHITDGVIDNATIDVADINDFSAEVADIADAQIANATIEQAQVRNLSVDYASASNLEAATGRISTLESTALTANSATIQNLEADTAKIHNLTANQISAATGYVAALTAGNVTAQNIISDHGDFNTVKANAAKVANLTAQELEADHATIGSLDANYAQIDMANVNNGWITNGTIKNAAIKSQMVESISASQLTAGTIDADEITVQNLRASSLTVQTADGYVYVGDKRIPTKEFLDSLKDELQAEIDGAIETFTVAAIPTLNNTPANEWVVSGDAEATRKLRAKHVGDIAYVVNSSSAQNGYCYRFAYDNTNQTFKWVLIKDSDVTAALSRLTTAEGKITGLETFESNTTSWIEETDEGLTTIRQNHTTLSGKVDKTVVETKQLWYTKSNTTAPGKPTAEVTSTSTSGNAWRVVVPAYNASYPNYYYCLQYKLADGTFAWSDVVRDIAMGESQQQGRKGVSDAATADGKAVAAQTTANSNIKSSVQLWFTKANTTAPDKPTAQVTTNSASTVNAWNLAIPTYNSSYPNYFSCYQQQKGDGTWQWTDVVFDRSITEAQAKAQAALPSSEFTTFQSTTFKNLVDEVDEQSSTINNLTTTVSNKADSSTVTTLSNTVNSVSQTTNSNSQYITNLTTTLGTNADGTSKSEDIVHKYNQLDQTLDGTISRVGTVESNVSGLTTRMSSAETSIEQNAADITLNAKKAEQLMTFVPTKHEKDDTDFWYSAPGATSATRISDGWYHYEYTNTGTSAGSTYLAPRNWGQIIPGEQYTFLVEVRNFSGASTGQLAYIQQMSGAQFWGGDVKKSYDDTANTSVYIQNLVDGAGEHRFVKVADTEHIGEGTTYDGMCFRYRIYLAAGVTTSFDIRISVYPGDYAGPYNEYLTATSSAQLKVANDEISAKVDEDGVIAAINLSVEEEGGSLAKISADKVNIEGAAIFTSGRLSETSISNGLSNATASANSSTDSKLQSYSTTTDMNQAISDSADSTLNSAKDYANDIQVAGENLLRRTARFTANMWARSNVSVPRAGVLRMNMTSSADAASTYKVDYLDFADYGEGTYTLSFEARKAPVESTYTETRIAAYIAFHLRSRIDSVLSSNYDRYKPATVFEDVSDEWKRYTITATCPDEFTIGQASALATGSDLTVHFFCGRAKHPVEIRRVKLERGSVATSYSEASSDTLLPYGGRNLLRNTKNEKAIDVDESTYTTSYAASDFLNSLELVGDETVLTYSFDYEVTGTVADNTYIYPQFKGSAPASGNAIVPAQNVEGAYTIIYVKDAMSGHYRSTFVITQAQETSTDINTNRIRLYNAGAGVTARIWNVKLEQGLVETPWTPAPEDVDASISSVSTVANNAASKSDAVYRQQRIWYRQTAEGSAPSTNTTWLATSGTGYGNWSLSVPQLTSGTTKYPKLYTAVQTQTVSQAANGGTTCSCSPVRLDDSTTIIDGGNIITGSVSANSINASSGTFDTANIPDLSATKITSGYISSDRIEAGSIAAGKLDADSVKTNIVQTTNLSADKITSGDISADRIKTNVISAINSLSAGTINGERINASQLTIGGSYLATQTDVDSIQIGGTNLLKKSADISACFTNISKVASIVGGQSDPNGGTDAYLITPTANQTSWYAGPASTNCVLKNLEVSYAFSIWLRADTATQCKLCCRYMDSTPYSSTATRVVVDVTTAWQRFYISAPLKQAQTIDSVWIGQVTDTPIYVYHPKVEVGTKPSDWSPAPEDVSSSIEEESNKLRASYGTCSTAAGTAAKVVTCENFELVTGSRIAINFTTANTTAAPTLNVNGTGAAPIWYNNAVAASGNPVLWGANATLSFVYDGTNWILDEKPPTYSGSSSTGASTRSKALSVAGALVVNGTTVLVRFSNANTYTSNSVQFNLSSTGAANIWVDNAATSSSKHILWSANTVITFTRNSNGWFVVSRSDDSKTATNFISLTSDGIKIADATPSTASTYQLQTATGTDFVIENKVLNRINADGMTLYDGNGVTDANAVAKFADGLIELGKNSVDAAVEFCAGKGRIAYNSATQFLQFTSTRLSNYAKSEDGTTMAASQVAAWFKTGETSGISTGNMANILNEANASYASSKISATRPVEGSDQKQAWVEVKATGSDSWVDLVANGVKINGGTSIKSMYMGTDVKTLNNGQWIPLKSASEVTTLLGSGASQANTICIAQNGDFDNYAGVVTGAMGQDGSARAYIYPNRTGSIRINYILIRFA